MQFKARALSDVGNKRKNNEDQYLCDVAHGLFVVADGVGGREKGEVASAMIADLSAAAAPGMQALAAQADPRKTPEHRERVLDAIRQHLQRINTAIYETHRDGGVGMASTADVLLINEHGAYLGHAGDSRVYLIRNEQIFRLTEDHTYAQRLRNSSRADIQQMMADPAQNLERFEHMLTCSIGTRPHVDSDTLFLEVYPGDRFILCTDGLTDYLSGQDILACSASLEDDALAQALVDEAKARGGHDNITLVVVDLQDDDAGEDTDPELAATRIDMIRQMQFLEQVQLFDGLSSAELLRVLRCVYAHRYSDGDVVLREGEESSALYLVVEGEVELTAGTRSVRHLGPGAYFGELAFFGDGHIRSATATCRADCILLRIPADKFEKLIGENLVLGNKLLINLVRNAGERIREMNRRTADISEGIDPNSFATPHDAETRKDWSSDAPE